MDSKKSPNLENSPKVIAIDQGWISGQLLGQRAWISNAQIYNLMKSLKMMPMPH